MFRDHLKANEVADAVKDRLDNMYELQQLPQRIYQKLIQTKPLIRAINEADIDITSTLKPEAQCIVFVPKDGFLVYLRNQPIHESQHVTSRGNIDIPPEQQVVFLNEQPWLYAHSIKTQYISLYKEYPIKGDENATKLKLAQYAPFYHGDTHSGYAYYEPSNDRIVLPGAVDDDTFVSFSAMIMAEKIDFTKFDDLSYILSDYKIVTPRYAEGVLINSALIELLPEGLEVKDRLLKKLSYQKREALSRQPLSRASFKVKNTLKI